MAKNRALSTDTAVSFRNSQGQQGQGTLMRLTRNSVVFEVYNPYSIVQLSEVLSDMRISRGERDIYAGRAVVTNLISTGLMLIVSASLVDPWSDLAGLNPGPELREEVDRFVQDWSTNNQKLRAGFKNSVTNLRNFLEELSRWLEHGEMVAGLNEPDAPGDLCKEFVMDVEAMVEGQLDELWCRFEESSREVAKTAVGVHKAFVQRELHPLVMCSPFLWRTYTKPLGYAGDYEMVNMMFRDPYEGNNAFAKVLNASSLRAEAPAAHRNRIAVLTEHVISEARRVNDQGRRFRVLNVGCGPAIEVRRFIEQSWLSDRAEFELVDFNEETLDHAREEVSEAIRRHRRRTEVKLTKRSVSELLQGASERSDSQKAEFDLVYCAGLFDYFGDPTCGYLLEVYYNLLLPGGKVLATNVVPGHSREGVMKYLQEWNLRLRDKQRMLDLAPSLGRQRAFTDSTGVNVFLEIRKPSDEESA